MLKMIPRPTGVSLAILQRDRKRDRDRVNNPLPCIIPRVLGEIAVNGFCKIDLNFSAVIDRFALLLLIVVISVRVSCSRAVFVAD